MTSCDLPRVQISDPGELIETVPYLLGFHPRESLVLIGFAGATGCPGPQQVQVSVRIDLPAVFDADELQPLVEVLRRADSAAVAAVLVTETVSGDPRQLAALLAWRDGVSAAMDSAAIEILDVLVATETRWWSLCCEQPECCPAAGRPRSRGCSAAAAQATFAGLVALPDREAMAATLAGRSLPERSALLPQLVRAQARAAGESRQLAVDRRQAVIAELIKAADPPVAGRPAVEPSGEELSEQQLTRYAVALTDQVVRDALWLAVDDGSIEASRLMSQLHSRLPAPFDAAPLFLFGWAQWRTGNATLAMMAAERVLESQPAYSAAVLLHTAVQRGLDPRTVPVLRQGAPPPSAP
jgi:Domain of unknown function (DUF4192)